jgi:hypothetical protein
MSTTNHDAILPTFNMPTTTIQAPGIFDYITQVHGRTTMVVSLKQHRIIIHQLPIAPASCGLFKFDMNF